MDDQTRLVLREGGRGREGEFGGRVWGSVGSVYEGRLMRWSGAVNKAVGGGPERGDAADSGFCVLIFRKMRSNMGRCKQARHACTQLRDAGT